MRDKGQVKVQDFMVDLLALCRKHNAVVEGYFGSPHGSVDGYSFSHLKANPESVSLRTHDFVVELHISWTEKTREGGESE